MYRKKVPICPSNNPPRHFTGLRGARASKRVGASWLSDIDAGAKVYLSAWRSRSCWCLTTCLRAHGSSVYKHDPRTLTCSYERASERRIPRAWGWPRSPVLGVTGEALARNAGSESTSDVQGRWFCSQTVLKYHCHCERVFHRELKIATIN